MEDGGLFLSHSDMFIPTSHCAGHHRQPPVRAHVLSVLVFLLVDIKIPDLADLSMLLTCMCYRVQDISDTYHLSACRVFCAYRQRDS